MALRHKHLRLDQEKLDRVRVILGAATETEAVDRALEVVLQEEVLNEALRQVRGTTRLRAVFEPGAESAH